MLIEITWFPSINPPVLLFKKKINDETVELYIQEGKLKLLKGKSVA